VVHQGTYRKERGNQGPSYEIQTFEYRTALGLNFHCDGPGISPRRSFVFSGMSEYFVTIRLVNDVEEASLKIPSWAKAETKEGEKGERQG